MHKGMSAWAAINYRGFYDVPRMFLIQVGSSHYLFDSKFSDEHDDYGNYYEIYLMPVLGEAQVRGDWTGLEKQAIRHLGRVKVSSVEFDSSKRKEINLDVLSQLVEQRT